MTNPSSNVALADRLTSARARLTSTPVLAVCGIVLLFEPAARWIVAPVVGTRVQFAGLAIVVSILLLGRSSRWAVGLGFFVSGSIWGDLAGAFAWSVAGVLAATVGSRLWARVHQDGTLPRLRWYAWYEVVAVVSVLVHGATVASVFELVDRAAFSVAFGPLVASQIGAVVVAAPVLRLALRRGAPSRWHDADRPLSFAATTAVVVTVFTWAVVGFGASYAFRVLELAPPGLSDRLPSIVYSLLVVWGDRGEFAVLLVALLALTVLATVLESPNRPRALRWLGRRLPAAEADTRGDEQ